MSDDYTTQAANLLDAAEVTNRGTHWGPVPLYTIELSELGSSIDVQAHTEDEARAQVLATVADTLRSRDPNYAPVPAPSATDAMLAAVEALDPKTATVEDVIAVAKSALVDAGATSA